MSEHISYRFDWREVQHKSVVEVLGLNADVMDTGVARWDAIAICVGIMAVVITVEPNTDQIIVTYEVPPIDDGWAPIPSFTLAIGKEIGWSWIGTNSLGYKDSFTVAFDDLITPQCTFVAVASSLYCFDLTERRA